MPSKNGCNWKSAKPLLPSRFEASQTRLLKAKREKISVNSDLDILSFAKLNCKIPE